MDKKPLKLRQMLKVETPQYNVSAIAKLMGLEKVSWSRAVKACKEAMKDGFDLDDFKLAATNMLKSPKKYHSLYSVFTKTDYWMNIGDDKKETPKGAW